jgi:hypothetical protein
MKCSCGRFEVPLCCKRYLEDAQGNLVHTETVCYEQGGFQLRVILPEAAGLIPLSTTKDEEDK